MLCPQVVPQPLTLGSLTDACANEHPGFCLVLARSQVEAMHDLTPEVLAHAPLAVRPFLASVLAKATVAPVGLAHDSR